MNATAHCPPGFESVVLIDGRLATVGATLVPGDEPELIEWRNRYFLFYARDNDGVAGYMEATVYHAATLRARLDLGADR